MRALVIGPEIEERAKELLAFASERENWYKPPFTKERAPGLCEDYVMHIDMGFRVVFSYTQVITGHLYKHLSVSVEDPVGQKLYPAPEAITMIAALFDFSGAKEANGSFQDWNHISTDKPIQMALDEEERCIIIAEAIEDAQHSN